VRVEVQGRDADGISVEILGAMDRPGVAGGAVAALAAVEFGAGPGGPPRARRVWPSWWTPARCSSSSTAAA
jgi:hypothetical protein